MKIDHVFTNFIACDDLSIDAKHIEHFCYDLQNKDPGRKFSNIGGWQSNDLDLSICIPKLYYEIKERLDELYFYFEFKDELSLKLDNSWININKKHNFNAIHDHSHSLFSGVYYVKAEENVGDIVFFNPSSAHSMCIESATIKTYNAFNSSNHCVTPRTGMLLLFPSWMKHFTNPNQTDKDRISISFNTFIIPE